MSAWPPPPPRGGASKPNYSMGGSAIKPPTTYHKKGYSSLATQQKFVPAGASSGTARRKPLTEDEYFEDDDEVRKEQGISAPYMPNPGSPGYVEDKNDNKSDEDDEEDPLDAFMAGIEKEVKQSGTGKKDKASTSAKNKGIRDDIEMEDDEESYYRYIRENPNAGKNDESDEEVEYDEFGEPIVKRSKWIDPLPPIDHAEIKYEPFDKNFYREHPDIEKLTSEEVAELRQKLGIKVTGALPPKPIVSFAHFGLDKAIMASIRKQEFTTPTPIQAQGIPAALSGRDLIGIAKTGSGKTAAFVWPMLVHIQDQRELAEGEGPIALILAPTRELSIQIYNEAKKYGKHLGLRIACCYGGGSKWEQSNALKEGAEVVVATPGRMIDLIKAGATNLQRVTYLVLDEADRMFDMGFEPQVRSICDHVRPDRQSLMFSATFKKKVEKLARHALADPLRIIDADAAPGGGSGVNEDITQVVHTFSSSAGAKWAWLNSHIVEFTSEGSLLVFVTRKANAEELSKNLEVNGHSNVLLHGDMEQAERNRVITAFRSGKASIMVATDVAARGLDIPSIRNVVNYDVARDLDTHVHRIGRTGRAGVKGTAYTLIDREKDKEFAGHLVRNLEASGQTVPEDLLSLANQCGWFRKSRFKSGKGKEVRDGLGYKERPGLGSSSTESAVVPKASSSPSATSSISRGPMGDRQMSTLGSTGSGRLSSVKQAYKAAYQSNFRSSVATSQATSTIVEEPKQASSEDGAPRKKKSRWD